MLKKLLLIILFAVLLASCDNNESLGSMSADSTPTQANDVVAPASIEKKVGYVTTDNFEAEVIKSEIPVLVDFTAVWCLPCKVVDPIISDLYPEMLGRAKVVKLDIDESPEIYEMLGVNGVPNILFFNDGIEQDRIVSPQPREVYVKYLEAMIEGKSTLDVSLELLDEPDFRRHFILTRKISDIEKALAKYPSLLTDAFENGQSPLSLILNSPSIRQNDQIALTLAQNPEISTLDLIGLGRCDEFAQAAARNPDIVNQIDADGNSAMLSALNRFSRLENGGCLEMLLGMDIDLSQESNQEKTLGRMVVIMDDSVLLKRFLDAGMDPEFTDFEGRNSLHWAASYGRSESVRTLLKHGVDPDIETANGKTAAQIVQDSIQRTIDNAVAGTYGVTLEDPDIQERINSKKQLLTILEGEAL